MTANKKTASTTIRSKKTHREKEREKMPRSPLISDAQRAQKIAELRANVEAHERERLSTLSESEKAALAELRVRCWSLAESAAKDGGFGSRPLAALALNPQTLIEVGNQHHVSIPRLIHVAVNHLPTVSLADFGESGRPNKEIDYFASVQLLGLGREIALRSQLHEHLAATDNYVTSADAAVAGLVDDQEATTNAYLERATKNNVDTAIQWKSRARPLLDYVVETFGQRLNGTQRCEIVRAIGLIEREDQYRRIEIILQKHGVNDPGEAEIIAAKCSRLPLPIRWPKSVNSFRTVLSELHL